MTFNSSQQVQASFARRTQPFYEAGSTCELSSYAQATVDKVSTKQSKPALPSSLADAPAGGHASVAPSAPVMNRVVQDAPRQQRAQPGCVQSASEECVRIGRCFGLVGLCACAPVIWATKIACYPCLACYVLANFE